MVAKVTRFLEANSLCRVRIVQSGEIRVMSFTEALEMIEGGKAVATELDRDGRPIRFCVSAPIDGHIHVVEKRTE